MNKEVDRLIKKALRQTAYHALPAQPGEAARILRTAQAQQFTGDWEGYGRLTLPKGTRVTLPDDRETSMEVPHDLIAVTTLHLTLESSGNSHITGDGELKFDLCSLGKEVVKSVYVNIAGDILEDARILFEGQSIEDTSHRVDFSGILSGDSKTLSGTYHAMRLITETGVSGDFSLEKVLAFPGDYEVITFEPMQRIIDLLRHARSSILVTHFTTDIPPDEYVSVMLERLRHDVAITRVVAFLPGASKEVYSWLKSFRKKDSTTRRHYSEYQISGTPLPLDITVIDDEIAVQRFATYPDASAYSFVICHYDARVARRLREYIEAFIPNQKLSCATTFMRKLTRFTYLG
jgi:hypothetical protein